MLNVFKLYAWADYFRWIARVRWLNNMGCFSAIECGMSEHEYNSTKRRVHVEDEIIRCDGYMAAMRLGLGPAGKPGDTWSIFDKQNRRWYNGDFGSEHMLSAGRSKDVARAWRLRRIELPV